MFSSQSILNTDSAGINSELRSVKRELFQWIFEASKLTTRLTIVTVIIYIWSVIARYLDKSNRTVRTNEDRISVRKPPNVRWYKANLPLILNGWCTLIEMWKDGLNLFTKLSQQYGETFQLPLGPIQLICTGDPVIIRALLSSNDPRHLTKSGFIYKRLFVEEMHDGLFVAPYRVWLPHRKCMSKSGFSYKSILSCLNLLNNYSRNLILDIDNYISQSNKNLADGDLFATYLSTRLLHFVGDFLTGPGSYTSKEISEIQYSISTHKRCLMHVLQRPHLFWRPLWRWSSQKQISGKASIVFLKAMRQMIANYMSASQTKKEDDREYQPLIKYMLNESWTEKEILDNFVTFVFAEHEATFAAIQFALFHLATNTDHQDTCRLEIDSVFDKLKPINDTVQLDMNDLSELTHLERCIMESLRLFPPVPLYSRRLGAPLPLPNGEIIETGRTVVAMPWVLHRNPTIYPNPEKFDPYRFLPENVVSRPHYSYIPFSAGRRNCLGWKLSQVQMKTTLAWILRHFEISTKDKLEDFTFHFAVRVIPDKYFNIEFKKRSDL